MVYGLVGNYPHDSSRSPLLNVIPKVRYPLKRTEGDAQEEPIARHHVVDQCDGGAVYWMAAVASPVTCPLPQQTAHSHHLVGQPLKQPSLRVGGVAVNTAVSQEATGCSANHNVHISFCTESLPVNSLDVATTRKTRTNKPYACLVPVTPEEEDKEQEGKKNLNGHGTEQESVQELPRDQQQRYLGPYQNTREQQRCPPSWGQHPQVSSGKPQVFQSDYRVQVGSNSCSNVTALSSAPSECSPIQKPHMLQQQASPPPYFGPQEDPPVWGRGNSVRSSLSSYVPCGPGQMNPRYHDGLATPGNTFNPQEHGQKMSTISGPQPTPGLVPHQQQEQQHLHWPEWQRPPFSRGAPPVESMVAAPVIRPTIPQPAPPYYLPQGDSSVFTGHAQGGPTPRRNDTSGLAVTTPSEGPFGQEWWGHRRNVSEAQAQWQPAPSPFPLPPSYNSDGSRPSSLSVSVEPCPYNVDPYENSRQMMYPSSSPWGSGPKLATTAPAPVYPSRPAVQDAVLYPQYVPSRGPAVQWAVSRNPGAGLHSL